MKNKIKYGNFREYVKKAFPPQKLIIDPFLSRFYRPFSLRLSWLLYRSGITPNFVTFNQIITGLLGCLTISLYPTTLGFLIGILILHFSYLLDCVDGEIARATKTESLQGLFLDKFAHAITMPAIFISVGYYYSQNNPKFQFTILLICLFASFATFNPVNRLVVSIVYQLGTKKEFQQYNLDEYKSNSNEDKKKEKNSSFLINIIDTNESKGVFFFAKHLFRHVSYLALITVLLILEIIGIPLIYSTIIWLLISLSLIVKELIVLYIVYSTNIIESRFSNLEKKFDPLEID